MPVRRSLAIVPVLLGMAGCSLLASLDGYSASDDAPEPTAPDASSDAADAGSTADAPTDAGGFCDSLSTAPKLCVDFDDGNLLAKASPRAFDDTFASGAQTGVPDNEVFFSPTMSARFAVTGDGQQTFLSRAFTNVPLPARVEYAMSMRVDAPSYLDLMEVRFGDPPTLFVFLARSTDGSLRIVAPYVAADGGDGAVEQTFGTQIVPGRWARYSLVIDTVASTATVSVDGHVVGQLVLTLVPVTPRLAFIAGITDNRGAATIWVDDVVADF